MLNVTFATGALIGKGHLLEKGRLLKPNGTQWRARIKKVCAYWKEGVKSNHYGISSASDFIQFTTSRVEQKTKVLK